MKKLFLAGIAALLLATQATTPANARPWAVFHCGKDLDMAVAWLPPKYFDDHKEHYFDFSDGEYSRRLPNRLFRWKVYRVKVDGELRRGSSLFYKGRKCEEFEDEEYGEW
jgi:hypothetical protein